MMMKAEKVIMKEKKPYVSCIKLNGVSILPPLLNKNMRTMAVEAKNKAMQLEVELGWKLDKKESQKEGFPCNGYEGSVINTSVQKPVENKVCKQHSDKDNKNYESCKCKKRDLSLRRCASVSCLADESLNTKANDLLKAKLDHCKILGIPLIHFTSPIKLRKCRSVGSLPQKDHNDVPSHKCKCNRSSGTNSPSVLVEPYNNLFSSWRQGKNCSSKSLSKSLETKSSHVCNIRGGAVISTASEGFLLQAHKTFISMEESNSIMESNWAAGIYRQLFPLDYEEDKIYDTESSEAYSERRQSKTSCEQGLISKTIESESSCTTSSEYVTTQNSSATLLQIPGNTDTDKNREAGYRLVRQGSYILEKPSDVLLDHLKKQSSNFEKDQAVTVTKESSVQTETDAFELLGVEEDNSEFGMNSKVSELREKLRKKFDAAMEMLLVKQRQEQEELAKTFLQIQQSSLLQMKASAVINAAARGYLIRRLMKTKYIQDLIETMEESLKCIFDLKGESLRPHKADQELYDRLLQQLTAACNTFYETFFDISTAERMKIITADRERLKYIQLKAASLGLHTLRPAAR